MSVCGKDSLILIPFRLPQISSFTLSLKRFSSDSDYCSDVGIGPLLQFPYLLRAGPVPVTLLFPPLVPSSHQVVRGSLYCFPLVRYSCLLTVGVLRALLCLTVYFWCIVERDVPHVLLPLHHMLSFPSHCSLHPPNQSPPNLTWFHWTDKMGALPGKDIVPWCSHVGPWTGKTVPESSFLSSHCLI